MKRVPVNPKILRWAYERSGIPYEELVARNFKKLPEWESGEAQPTLRQAEAFARKVHVPFGYLFFSEPPEEELPIRDFRVLDGQEVTQPSVNLLDTIYACQGRQGWYRDFALENGQPELDFIGSVAIDTPVKDVAAKIRDTLDFTLENRRKCSNWEDALRLFRQQAEEAGVLVMANGVVGNNTHRPLDPSEFRGFALSDPLAPLIFINNKDAKAAQMFTLAHELAHLWLGFSALSNIGIARKTGFRREEVWCNAVAAELLVPEPTLRDELHKEEDLDDALKRLARIFKVSTLVILRRLLDVGGINRGLFNSAWEQEKENFRGISQSGGGGDFYSNTFVRVGRPFIRALVASTLEGQTLYRDAFQMLGISKTETFNNLGREAGIIGNERLPD